MSCSRAPTDHAIQGAGSPGALKVSLPIPLNFCRMSAFRAACAALALALLAGSSGGAGTPAPFPNIPYATWSNDEPQYRLYPGDELDVTIASAPELNKTVTV